MADLLVFSQKRNIPQFYIFHFQFPARQSLGGGGYITSARRRVGLLGADCRNRGEEEKHGSVN